MTALAAKVSGWALGRPDLSLFAGQVGIGLALLAAWQAFGGAWTSRPSDIAAKLLAWAAGDLYLHVWTTVAEMVAGLAIGAAAGVVLGLVLGRAEFTGAVLRPLIVALYSVQLVSLAPLMIMFFGLDMAPKIILVALVTFFLIFFNTFSGASTVDRDLVSAAVIMGANRRQQFQKVVAPGSMAWILSGFRVALPYALVAATTGEMLAARRGLGFLLTQSSSRFDIAGVYAVLVVLMALGILTDAVASTAERRLLRWRHATEL